MKNCLPHDAMKAASMFCAPFGTVSLSVQYGKQKCMVYDTVQGHFICDLWFWDKGTRPELSAQILINAFWDCRKAKRAAVADADID